MLGTEKLWENSRMTREISLITSSIPMTLAVYTSCLVFPPFRGKNILSGFESGLFYSLNLD